MRRRAVQRAGDPTHNQRRETKIASEHKRLFELGGSQSGAAAPPLMRLQP